MSIKIPDLRFEQSFMRSLEKNALSSDGFELEAKTNKKNHHHKRGTNDDTNDGTNDGSMKPIKAVITPQIVIYTVIKDTVVVPLVEGFAIAGALMIARPFLQKIFQHGRDFGIHVFGSLGLTNVKPQSNRFNLKR